MERDQLRAIQAPIKESYERAPESAVVTLEASGDLGEGISCSVKTGRVIAEAGLHPASGGDGTLLCSGDLLLEALVACAGQRRCAPLRPRSGSRSSPVGSTPRATSTSVAPSQSTARRRSGSGRSASASSSTPTPTGSSWTPC
ncbi:MAG TPA: hypothetical protein VHM66_07155 [Solirubrobacterales bacterium]|nr:hypothetical protein [Solirubrobacterales bacterium]